MIAHFIPPTTSTSHFCVCFSPLLSRRLRFVHFGAVLLSLKSKIERAFNRVINVKLLAVFLNAMREIKKSNIKIKISEPPPYAFLRLDAMLFA